MGAAGLTRQTIFDANLARAFVARQMSVAANMLEYSECSQSSDGEDTVAPVAGGGGAPAVAPPPEDRIPGGEDSTPGGLG